MLSLSFLPCFAVSSTLSQLPAWYVYGFAFVVGATVGSFLNVCILRIPEEGVSIFYPRGSRCPYCHTDIRWYDNIPILSWLWLRGRCRVCKAPISIQYPLVELVTAVLAVAVVKRFGLHPVALVWFAFLCALLVITFIDMAWWIIPDVITLPAIPIGVGLAYLVGDPMPSWQSSAIGAAAGAGLFLAISQGYALLMKREGMGMGDAKLLGMIGAFLGWKSLPLVILLASAQGLLAALLLYALGWREGVPDDFYDDEDEEFDAEASPHQPKEGDAAHAHDVSPSNDIVLAVEGDEEEDDEVGLRGVAIPFGPFLSLAAIEFLFWGESLYVWLAKVLHFSL